MQHIGNIDNTSTESNNLREQLTVLIDSLTIREMDILIGLIELFKSEESSYWQEILEEQK